MKDFHSVKAKETATLLVRYSNCGLVQPAEGEKFYCGPDVGKCPTKKSDCEAVAEKGECEKIKIDLPE